MRFLFKYIQRDCRHNSNAADAVTVGVVVVIIIGTALLLLIVVVGDAFVVSNVDFVVIIIMAIV